MAVYPPIRYIEYVSLVYLVPTGRAEIEILARCRGRSALPGSAREAEAARALQQEQEQDFGPKSTRHTQKKRGIR